MYLYTYIYVRSSYLIVLLRPSYQVNIFIIYFYFIFISDEENAELRLVEYLNLAINADPLNFDAYVAFTTYLKTIGKYKLIFN